MDWRERQLRHAEGVEGEGKQPSQPQLLGRHEEPHRNGGRNAKLPQLGAQNLRSMGEVCQPEPTRGGDIFNLWHRRLQDGQTNSGEVEGRTTQAGGQPRQARGGPSVKMEVQVPA